MKAYTYKDLTRLMNVLIESTRRDGSTPITERNHDRELFYATKIYQTVLRLVDINRDLSPNTPVIVQMSPECFGEMKKIFKNAISFRYRAWFEPLNDLMNAYVSQHQQRRFAEQFDSQTEDKTGWLGLINH